jgi:hypothetical protein
MDEEVIMSFGALFTKGAQPAVWPSTLGEAISRPNPVLV